MADSINQNPTFGQLLVYAYKRIGKVKLLYWEDNGFWLLNKRIEHVKLCFPDKDDRAMSLTKTQLQRLLSGLGFSKQNVIKPLVYQHFI